MFGRKPGWAASLLLLAACCPLAAWRANVCGAEVWEGGVLRVSEQALAPAADQPLLEAEPSWNLYWHDPGMGWRHGRRCFSPAALGCPPLWYAAGEAVFLARDPSDTFPYAAVGPGGPVVLSSSSFDDEFEAAGRATLGRSFGDWLRVEVSYLGAPDWSDTAFVRNVDDNSQGGVGNLTSPLSGFGQPNEVIGLDFNDFASIRFGSKLQSGEVNVRRRLALPPARYEASVLLGMRLLEIDESFGYLATSTTPGPGVSQNSLDVQTDNELIGVQLGLTGQFLVRPRLWIDADLRGGIYNNNASQTTQYAFRNGLGAISSYANQASGDRTAFVGEVKLQLNCNLARHLTAYAGYNALFVSGVALAENNVETDYPTLLLGPGRLDHGGDVIYHGPHLGLVWTR